MNHEEVRQKIYDVVSKFFVGATVIWAEQIMTTPPTPYVTLKLGTAERTLFGCDDEGQTFRTDKAPLEINLYTKGRKIEVGKGKLTNHVNTVVSDMTDFMDFMDSQEVHSVLGKEGISIIPRDNKVNDLSEIENETQYQYRAMVEFVVSYIHYSSGKYGISLMGEAVNPSGGGSEELKTPVDEIESIEINGEEILNQGGKDEDEK